MRPWPLHGLLLSFSLSPIFPLSGCVRDTLLYCDASTPCADDGQMCLLPDHECTTAQARAELSGTQQVPPTSSAGLGSFKMILSSDQTRLTYTLSFGKSVKGKDLVPAAVHIHNGKPGESGPVIFPLKAQNNSSDTLTLAPDQQADLQAGNYYVDVHTAAFGDGEVRGQIVPLQPPAQGTIKLFAVLSGLQEGPPNASPGTGRATLTLDQKTGEMSYAFNQTLPDVTGIHLHRGRPSENGPHIEDLPLTQGSAPMSGKLTRDKVLLDQQAVYTVLVAGGISYLNVHTTTKAGGELRGQFLRSSKDLAAVVALPFNAALSGKQVNSSADGTVHFFLSEDQTRLTYRLEHSAADPTEAGIYSMRDQSLACALGMGHDQDQGSCEVKAAGGSGGLVLGDLLAADGGYFVLVKTKANPAGELRGQVVVPR